MSTTTAAFVGTVRYEFRMQVRRPAIWVAVGAITVLILGTAFRGNLAALRKGPTTTLALEATVAGIGSYFLPIVFGILLADRLPRERRLGTSELLESLPVGDGLRLWGKFVGAVTATLIPLVVGYITLTASVAFRLPDAGLLAAFVPVFLLEVLPGLLFVGAFSLGCPALLPVPLYAVLFTGYWFWGNLVLPSRVPTVSCTPLTPIGKYASVAFFGARGQDCGLIQHSLGAAGGAVSIVLLLAGGGLLLLLVQFLRHLSLTRR